MRSLSLLALTIGLLGACKDDRRPPMLLDTGWFTEADIPECLDRVAGSIPEANTTDWFYLEQPSVLTDTVDPTAYQIMFADADGRLIAHSLEWSVQDGSATIVPDQPLTPGTDYEIVVQDCNGITTIPFSTSPLGLPLSVDPRDLSGRTYRLDLGGANWVRPEGLGPLIAGFLTEPILLGVIYADDQRMDLLGAPSVVDGLGNVRQAVAPTWDFPIIPFEPEVPTFEVTAEQITLQIVEEGIEAPIPVTDFVLKGTLAADGQSLGGGVLSGIADTRELSAAFFGEEDSLCLLAEASFQLPCDPCESDGQAFCFALEGRDLNGTQQPGLTLVDRTPNP